MLAWGLLGAALLAYAPHGYSNDRTPAVETFRRLQGALVGDKERGDWGAFLDDAQRLKAFLNGAPTSGLEVARAQIQLGHPEAALAETKRFLGMGQLHDILGTPLFLPIRKALDKQVAGNRAPISLARPAFPLFDPSLLPEDIDFDPTSKRFFVTSIVKHNIVSLDSAGHPRAFADSPDHWPMVAIKVDAKRRLLWATEVALDGFAAVPPSDWGRSALLEYDLDRGTLRSRHDGPPHANLGDLTLAGNGDPIVSDGTGGGIYRLRGTELRRIDHGDFISPQTIAICPDGRHAYVPDYVRGVAAFDLETGATRWLSMKDRYALDGIDGLYCRDGSLVAVQNGTSPERVVVFSLDPSRTAIVAETVVERSTSTLGVPTHGVFVGTTFHYIANSGWDALDERGVARPARRLDPAVIMRVDGAAMSANSPGP